MAFLFDRKLQHSDRIFVEKMGFPFPFKSRSTCILKPTCLKVGVWIFAINVKD